jgi:hypothetical protein
MFAIYKRLDDLRTHKFVRQVDGLGGGAGPVAKHVRGAVVRNELVDQTFYWHLSERALLAQYLTGPEKANGQDYRLMIDLKPKSEDELLFFQILDVWGCSEPGWTPVMLKLCFLFEAETAERVQEVRKAGIFVSDVDFRCAEGLVYEFLYLKFGWKDGDWGWGTVGSVNGALLFPRHLKFFLKEMIRPGNSSS